MLPRGCCRLRARNCGVKSVSSDHVDQTAEATKHAVVPISGPVIVADQCRGTFLCQMEPQILTRNIICDTLNLCYHDCVQLVPWEKEGAETQKDVCVESIRGFVPFASTMEPMPDSMIKGNAATTCLDPTNHLHTTVSTALLDINDIDNGSFLGYPRSSSVTKLMAVSMKQVSTGEVGGTEPLLLSYVKRQMAGLYIAFVEKEITTEVRLTSPDGKDVCFRVETIFTKHNKDKSFLYIILPSTRITLLAGDPKLEQAAESSPVKSSFQHGATSPVSRLLIETVRCLRNQSTSFISKSFLLAGPPGVGKTFSVKVAYETCKVEGPTLFLSLGSLLGTGANPRDGSRLLEKSFKKAAQACSNDSSCVAILLIDECDALLSSGLVAGMLSSLLDQCSQNKGGWQRLVIVAATNRIDSIPSHLRRPGRFDKEIHVCPPTAQQRANILQSLLKSTTDGFVLDPTSLREIAEACVGYVPADLASLVRRVAALALEDEQKSLAPDLFWRAMTDIGASALRDSSLWAPPATSWDDIAGDPGSAKTILRQAIEWPRTKSDEFRRLGLLPPKGILLFGPPGCAKTSLARAAAAASGSAFISFSPADVYASSYMGEAEATVRAAFKLARSATPCILFFDEIDSILGSDRDAGPHGMNRSGGGSSAESRVLSTFLNEMDGVDGSWEDGVLVLGATNRPKTLDKALLRPGRFDKVIYVPPPDYEGRLCILNMFCRAWKTKDIDTEYLASEDVTGRMTGAEIVGACRAAAMGVLDKGKLEDVTTDSLQISQNDLEEQLKATKPLLSDPEKINDFLRFEENCRRVQGR